MKFGTKAIHAGIEPEPITGAVMTPIFQTSTYAQEGIGKHKGYEYARTQNPTRTVLEKNIAALENGSFGLCFASGMAAVDAVIKLLKQGDEIIACNDLYGGTYRIITKIFEGLGINAKFVDMENPSNIESYITPKTKLIWVETPTNPLLNLIDIEEVAKISKKHQITLCVDNTFATPYLQNPLDLGADIVMHSMTKYLGGHSDVVMGALVTNNADIHSQLAFIQNSCGAVPSPHDCFLMLRGIKTLHIRMDRHSENGKKVAEYLTNHQKIGKVYWIGLPTHKNHEIAKKQMRGFGGMVAFTLKNDSLENAIKVMESFEVFTLGESLGGVESLCTHPATMTHAAIPKADREARGLSDTLIRLSVGIEDAEDLIADLENALKNI
ncbi:MAG: cystathionine gamma-synthase [Bacteroidetes bacterium]|nr:MAG: cystathionine gamma-synthase [Bacteroidota bacterium]TAG86066.1 MAG: cystathionine gamma-synthase [Bacteroidota bacterium]